MTAAQRAGADKDFATEAILERAALGLAEAHDPQSMRPALTRFPLTIAYIMLDRDDLWRAAGLASFGHPEREIDARLRDYIGTLHDFAVKYREYQNAIPDSERDQRPFRVFHYGATRAFEYEVMLRARLVPDDLDLLARAEAYLALSVGWTDARGAEKPYSEAIHHFADAQLRRDMLEMASNRFAMDSDEPDGAASLAAATGKYRSPNISLDQVTTIFLEGENLVWLVGQHMKDTVVPEQRGANPIVVDKSSDLADQELGRAEELYTQLQRSMAVLERSWPHNPMVANLDKHFAELYAMEFKLTKRGSRNYPDSLQRAKEAFERALCAYTDSRGKDSSEVTGTAGEYVSLLLDAGQRRGPPVKG
jgi:hypothetical protein